MKLRASAKVNLHLHILGRRPDGFHDLETLMVPLDFGDEMTVSISIGRTVQVRCDDPAVPVGADNLVVKAAQLFSEATGRQFGAEIELEKNIPMGAGLGGGSSDAAAVLIALDVLFETQLGVEGLEKLAARLGSDCAFFIRRTPSLCRGRGEIIEPCLIPETLSLLLIKPPFGVSTPWAYKNWAASRPLPGDYEAPQSLGWTSIVNSLERPVFEKYLFLPVLKNWLRAQPETRAAAMSGSGSTMFAVLHPGADGAALETRVRETFGPSLWTKLCATRSE